MFTKNWRHDPELLWFVTILFENEEVPNTDKDNGEYIKLKDLRQHHDDGGGIKVELLFSFGQVFKKLSAIQNGFRP